MDSRGPPDHLPTGPLTLPPRLHGFNNTVYYSDAPATTPSGTTRQRDLHLQRCRTPWAPEPAHPQRQELNTVFENTTVRDDTKDTPEGSTETLVVHYTAGRVPSTATPPHRVLFISDPALATPLLTTPTPSPTSTPALDTELTYPAPRTQPSRITTGGKGAAHGNLGQLQQASPVHEPHLPEVDQPGCPRRSPPSASGLPHGRRPRCT